MPENNVKVAAIYVKWIKGWARGIFKLLDADMKQYLHRKIKKREFPEQAWYQTKMKVTIWPNKKRIEFL